MTLGATRMSAVPTRTTSIGPGRPVAAFDVGGTDIKSAVFDADGVMFGLSRTPTIKTKEDSPAALLRQLSHLRRRLAALFPDVDPLGAGVVVPGVVDDAKGIARYSANLGWSNAPVKRLCEAEFDLPVAFSQDVRAAGLAEFQLGAARPFLTVNVIVIGTGIAGALFVDGQAYASGGYAGEIGHSITDPTGPECHCGAKGCLESVASAGAIARRYAELTGIEPAGAEGVLSLAEGGDETAQFVWSQAIEALATNLAQQSAMLAPEAFVIGGGLAEAGDALFTPLAGRLNALLSYHRRPRLLPAQLGENAGLIGAALLARNRSELS